MQLTTGTLGSIVMSPLSQYTMQSNKWVCTCFMSEKCIYLFIFCTTWKKYFSIHSMKFFHIIAFYWRIFWRSWLVSLNLRNNHRYFAV